MKVIQSLGVLLFLVGLAFFTVMPFLGDYTLTEDQVLGNTKDIHQKKMAEILSPMYSETYSSNFSFLSAYNENFNEYNEALKAESKWDEVIWDDYSLPLAQSSLSSPVRDNPWLFLGLSIGLAVLGGLMYNLPKYQGEPSGIKNNGIFHSSMKNRGWMGKITGAYLILFYIILYWFPAYIVNQVWMVTPLSMILSGNPANPRFTQSTLFRFQKYLAA